MLGTFCQVLYQRTLDKLLNENERMESPHVVQALFGDQRPLFEVGLGLRQRRGRQPTQPKATKLRARFESFAWGGFFFARFGIN